VKNLLIVDIKERTFYVMDEFLKLNLYWLDDALAVYGLALQILYLFSSTSIIPSTVQLPFLDTER